MILFSSFLFFLISPISFPLFFLLPHNPQPLSSDNLGVQSWLISCLERYRQTTHRHDLISLLKSKFSRQELNSQISIFKWKHNNAFVIMSILGVNPKSILWEDTILSPLFWEGWRELGIEFGSVGDYNKVLWHLT